MHTAIAIESHIDHIDEEALLRYPHDILDLVGGLLNVTDKGYVTLAHMSIKDYLLTSKVRDGQATSNFSLSADHSNAVLFRCCMAYISFAHFREGPSRSSEDYFLRVKKFPLFRHAAISWPYYYRAATPSEDLRVIAMRLFEEGNRSLFTSWVQCINADNPFCWDFYPRHATSLYYAATFGLTNIVEGLIRLRVNLDLPGSRYGGTALHGAVYRLHTPVVKLLLEAGADINKADFLKVTPLHTAATLGDIDLIKLLLHFSADTKATDNVGESPLEWAIQSGQIQNLNILQGIPANDNCRVQVNQTTLWKASNATIPYFPDTLHKHRSGMESSIVFRVVIGTDVLIEEDLPCFSS
ncbi:ankyrin repeat-containing domain protein [Hypoxylon fuscum]|nr:ankyrin repeat-containing domain protein [Hypoxylon fuscum]